MQCSEFFTNMNALLAIYYYHSVRTLLSMNTMNESIVWVFLLCWQTGTPSFTVTSMARNDIDTSNRYP